MNKTIISILICLVCMPCMVVAETSKELEKAIEKTQEEVNVLFDTNDTEAYTQTVHKLMDLCQKANNEELYYKSWSNLAIFMSRYDTQKGLKVRHHHSPLHAGQPVSKSGYGRSGGGIVQTGH